MRVSRRARNAVAIIVVVAVVNLMLMRHLLVGPRNHGAEPEVASADQLEEQLQRMGVGIPASGVPPVLPTRHGHHGRQAHHDRQQSAKGNDGPASDRPLVEPPKQHHAGKHQHHHHHHQEQHDDAAGTQHARDASAGKHRRDRGQADSKESDGGKAATSKPHHGKDSFYNVNKPDDMKPAQLDPVHVFLDAVNRSYLTFHVVGDWGGPGRPPQKRVAAAMGEVAVKCLSAVLPSNATNATHQETTDAVTEVNLTAADGTAKRVVVAAGPFRCATGPGLDGTVDFVVSTGDNMYEDGVADEHDTKLARNFEQVYTHPALRAPRWYLALGNHDHGAHGVMRDVRGQIRYTRLSSRWFLPSSYYVQRFIVHDRTQPAEGASGATQNSTPNATAAVFTVDLVVLDVYDVSPFMTKMSDGQLAWFEATLNASDADWKVVVGHRPIVSAGTKHGSSPYMRKHVLEALTRHNVAVYLSGDDHDLQVLEAGGALHVVSGGGSRAKNDMRPNGVPETLFQAPVNGFVNVQVVRDAIAVSVVDDDGATRYRVVRKRRI